MFLLMECELGNLLVTKRIHVRLFCVIMIMEKLNVCLIVLKFNMESETNQGKMLSEL